MSRPKAVRRARPQLPFLDMFAPLLRKLKKPGPRLKMARSLSSKQRQWTNFENVPNKNDKRVLLYVQDNDAVKLSSIWEIDVRFRISCKSVY